MVVKVMEVTVTVDTVMDTVTVMEVTVTEVTVMEVTVTEVIATAVTAMVTVGIPQNVQTNPSAVYTGKHKAIVNQVLHITTT